MSQRYIEKRYDMRDVFSLYGRMLHDDRLAFGRKGNQTETFGLLQPVGGIALIIKFEVRGKPEPQGSTKAFYIKSIGRTVTTSSNRNLKGWRQRIAEEAQKVAPDALILEPVSIAVGFQMPKPKNYPKKRKLFHTKKPDLDKLIRSVGDAITNVLIRDDSQIISIVAEKIYSDTPGCTVSIETVEAVM